MLGSNEGYYFVNEMMHSSSSHHDADQDLMIRNEHLLNHSNDDQYRPRQRRRQVTEAKKVCRVCGDKAFSVNFNVITCESCKAFFRRNALKTKELRCQTSGKCEVSLQTRRSCKKCRLRKCFEVGMIKEWIMSDEARLRKRQLIEKNREKRQRLSAMGKSCDSDDDGDDLDGDGCPRSNECDSPVDYKPLICTVPNQSIDYSLATDWRSSPYSALFQHTPTSAFQPPFVLTSPAPLLALATAPYCAALPIDCSAAIASTELVPTTVAPPPVEEMIRVPKTLLAALINQCHNGIAACSHQEETAARPSVIVSNKGTPLNCICRCRCGAKATWSPMGDCFTRDKSTGSNCRDSDSSCISCSNSDFEESESVGSFSDMSLVSSKKSKPDLVLDFKFGLSNSKIFHLEDLFLAFKYPKVKIGGPKSNTELTPSLPPIDQWNAPSEYMCRTDAMLRRLVRFCGSLMTTSNLRKKVLQNLVKGCLAELMLLHSSLAYSSETDAWYDQGPSVRPITASSLKELKGGVYEEHIRFVLTLQQICKNDVATVIILCAIVLFNPNRVDAKDRENVQLSRDFYSGLLTQYLFNKFDADKATRLRDNLLSHLETCCNLASRVTPTVVMELDERDMEPLLIELYGL